MGDETLADFEASDIYRPAASDVVSNTTIPDGGVWGAWSRDVLGGVSKLWAMREFAPDATHGAQLGTNGYYRPGMPGAAAQARPQGGVSVSSDVLILIGLAAAFFFASKD